MALGAQVRRTFNHIGKRMVMATRTAAKVARHVGNAVIRARPVYDRVGRPLLQMHGVDTEPIDRTLRHYDQLGMTRILNTYDGIRAIM